MKLRTVAISAIAGFALAFAWHCACWRVMSPAKLVQSEETKDVAMSMNLLTNTFRMRVALDKPDGLAGAFASGLIMLMKPAMEQQIEKMANDSARAHFDVYAMVLPYRVSLEIGPQAAH